MWLVFFPFFLFSSFFFFFCPVGTRGEGKPTSFVPPFFPFFSSPVGPLVFKGRQNESRVARLSDLQKRQAHIAGDDRDWDVWPPSKTERIMNGIHWANHGSCYTPLSWQHPCSDETRLGAPSRVSQESRKSCQAGPGDSQALLKRAL